MVKERTRIIDNLGFGLGCRSIESGAVIDSFEPGIEKGAPIFIPSSIKGIGLYFFAPFKDNNFFKTASFDHVFMGVTESIRGGTYLRTESPPLIPPDIIYSYDNKIVDEWFTQYYSSQIKMTSSVLESLKRSCSVRSDLLKNSFDSYSNTVGEIQYPVWQNLLEYLGFLVYLARNGNGDLDKIQNNEAKKIARSQIERILKKPAGSEYKKREIPSSLYLQGFREYLHEITKYLKTKLRKHGSIRNNIQLHRLDPRLIDIAQKACLDVIKGRNWRLVTDTFLAEFLSLSIQGLHQRLKEENKFIKAFSTKSSTRKR